MRRIAVLDAPSNLGLRPPTVTSVPGCAKAPGALRDHDLLPRLSARDAGCLTPPRYDPGDWRPGDGVAHLRQIAAYSRKLAERISAILDADEFPVVLGGDCSILIGAALAMRRRASELDGHIGLIYVDGHSDFRHPANAAYVGAAAGEDLAIVTGRGAADLAAMDALRPYFRDIDVVVLGIRSTDEHRLDLQAAGIAFRAVPQLRVDGAPRTAEWARQHLTGTVGYWLHIDVDVLDPAVMPAVDAPNPGGIAYTELEQLLTVLVATPQCLGVEVTVFDPDYDVDGRYASEIVDTLVAGLTPVISAYRAAAPTPDTEEPTADAVAVTADHQSRESVADTRGAGSVADPRVDAGPADPHSEASVADAHAEAVGADADSDEWVADEHAGAALAERHFGESVADARAVAGPAHAHTVLLPAHPHTVLVLADPAAVVPADLPAVLARGDAPSFIESDDLPAVVESDDLPAVVEPDDAHAVTEHGLPAAVPAGPPAVVVPAARVSPEVIGPVADDDHHDSSRVRHAEPERSPSV